MKGKYLFLVASVVVLGLSGNAVAVSFPDWYTEPAGYEEIADPTAIGWATQQSSYYPTKAFDNALTVGYIADGGVAPKGGTNTFVDFDFGEEVTIGGFAHLERNWGQDNSSFAHIDTANLIFTNTAPTIDLDEESPTYKQGLPVQDVIATVVVDHVGGDSGVTVVTFTPVTARYVRWDVTALADAGNYCGAEEFAFLGAPIPEPGVMMLAGFGALVLLLRRKR